jgi:hypothetical protein
MAETSRSDIWRRYVKRRAPFEIRDVTTQTTLLYSHLAPSHFLLFPTLEMGPKGTGFATMEGIKWNATGELRKITKKNFHRLPAMAGSMKTVCACVWVPARARGSYFEGN